MLPRNSRSSQKLQQDDTCPTLPPKSVKVSFMPPLEADEDAVGVAATATAAHVPQDEYDEELDRWYKCRSCSSPRCPRICGGASLSWLLVLAQFLATVGFIAYFELAAFNGIGFGRHFSFFSDTKARPKIQSLICLGRDDSCNYATGFCQDSINVSMPLKINMSCSSSPTSAFELVNNSSLRVLIGGSFRISAHITSYMENSSSALGYQQTSIQVSSDDGKRTHYWKCSKSLSTYQYCNFYELVALKARSVIGFHNNGNTTNRGYITFITIEMI